MSPRGIRDSNPGNLRPGVPYQGITGTDHSPTMGDYLVFMDMQHGIRAVAECLRAYELHHGIHTLLGVFQRWAPASDNNQPSAYARVVAEDLGVDIHDDVSLTDPKILFAIIKAIVRVENGPPVAGHPQWVPDDVITAGISMAT